MSGDLSTAKPATIGGLFTSDDVDSRMLYKEFQEGVDQFNEAEWALVERFVRKTQKESVRIWQRNMDFKTAGEGYLEDWQKTRAQEISVPLSEFEIGYAFTKKAIQDSNASELRETQQEILRSAQRLLLNRFFWAICTPGSGSVSKGFWDGNMAAASVRGPPSWKRNTFTTAHNHFASAGHVDIALADLSALKKEIREHGYSGELFLYLSGQEVEACENLAGWTSAMTPNPITEQITTGGFDVVKKFQGWTVVQDDFVPAGYLIGLESRVRPVTMREPLNPAGRGLKLWEGPYAGYPLAEAYYSQRFDMAVVHRGAGAIRQLTAGAWATPTFTF